MRTKNTEKVTLDLIHDLEEASTAKVETEIGEAGEGWATTTTDLYVNADSSDQMVWVNIRQHTFASVGNAEPISVSNDIISKHLTRAEAEALLAVLEHEISKF